MRWVQLATARTLSCDLPRRPSAAGTFVVYAPAGGVVQSSTAATLDSVDTTLSGAAAQGATSVSVTSATGITAGRRYLLGGAEADGGEVVLVRSVSGTTITLARALQYARASGTAFASARVSFAVGASAAAAIGRGYRVEYTWPAGDAQQVEVVPFDVTRFTPSSSLTTDDLRSLDAQIGKKVSSGVWLPDVIERTWEMILRRVAQKAAPGGFAGLIDLTTAHDYLTRAVLLESAGDEFAATRNDLRARFEQEFDAALAAAAYSDASTGAVTTGGGWHRGVRLVRG